MPVRQVTLARLPEQPVTYRGGWWGQGSCVFSLLGDVICLALEVGSEQCRTPGFLSENSLETSKGSSFGKMCGIFFPPKAFLALGGEKRAGLYLVTAGGHPRKRFARAFDLLFQGTKRGLLSEVDIRWPCWLLLYLDWATEDMPRGILGLSSSSHSPEAGMGTCTG